MEELMANQSKIEKEEKEGLSLFSGHCGAAAGAIEGRI
jgi:hypothetical protein